MLHALRLLGPLQVRQSRKQLVDRNLPRVYMARGGLNVIVSGDILQRKGLGGCVILSGLSQKSTTQSVQAGIGMEP